MTQHGASRRESSSTENKSVLKESLVSRLKFLIEESLSSQIKVRTYRNDIFFCLAEEEQEVLGLRFLTGTHIPMGALLAITYHVKVIKGGIYETLRTLIAKAGSLPSIYTEYSSNLSKYAFFRNHGIASFYPHDDVEVFTNTLYPILLKEFVLPTFTLLKEGIEVIGSVVVKPKVYAYPLATILVLLSRLGTLGEYERVLSTHPNFSPSDRGFVFANNLIEKLRKMGG